jgi:hypothetical protein
MRGTKLDERMLKLLEEIAGAVSAVRIYGTASATEAAEELLNAVGGPLVETDRGEGEMFANMIGSRTSFLTVVRRELRSEPLVIEPLVPRMLDEQV